jgi:hypothetical protein
MLNDQIERFIEKIDLALNSENIAELQEVSLQCDCFLRNNLPLNTAEAGDPAQLIHSLKSLSIAYQSAIKKVNLLKQKTQEQLHSVTKSHSNTHKYLDVARQFGG